MARRVPITIPAIAPPLKPLLVVVDCMPAAVAPEVPVGDGVSNATVVVADPVEVTVSRSRTGWPDECCSCGSD